MRAIRISALLALLIAPAAVAQTATEAAATITTADAKKRVEFLASDSLRGRDTPSPGLEIAARYIADEFRKFGVKPAGDSGTFIQRWPFASKKLDVTRVSAMLHGKGGHQKLGYASEYFVVPSPMTDSLTGELLFAGIGNASATPKPAYQGAIVAFVVPGGDLDPAWQQNVQASIIAGLTAGARGVVLILDPAFDAGDIANLVTNISGAQIPVPVLGVRHDAAVKWLDGTGVDLGVTQAPIAEPRTLAGFAVDMRAVMTGSAATPPNVVGMIEGSDPELKNTYVVYSAHMDHVGVGSADAKGDSIYNGADDNASGTTAVIEVAEAFAAMKVKPKRSILFVLVSGEEKGLYGSRHFVEHPPVPTAQMVANINLDMVGRNSADSTVVIGQEMTTLGPLTHKVANAHPDLKLTITPDLWPEEQLFTRSDHFNFAMKKIPAIFFTTGLHDDYHKPSDEAARIDYDKIARTAKLVFFLGNEIAGSTTVPTWTEAGLRVINQAPGTN